jgi:tetratricopeptide (TPR) repeat protein
LNEYACDWSLAGKNLKSALKAAKKSIELKDTDNAWDTLSLVYWKMGKYQEAIEAEEKALQLAGGKDKDYEKRISDIKAEMEKKDKNKKLKVKGKR